MQVKFKLLISNPCLTSSDYASVDYGYLKNSLACDLCLPKISTQPFIFSCFALSSDGKLCYPDLNSGYAIAKNNNLATREEQLADWWNLLLGRTISDAVIIGGNSLSYEKFSYFAEINIDEFIQIRQQLGKPKHLVHILITRDPSKINFKQELLCQENEIPLLIYSLIKPQLIPANFRQTSLAKLDLTIKKQIIYDELNFDLKALIQKLQQLGVQRILNESPYYHHQLQQLELLNEAWLNTSGVYIGGKVAHLGQYNNSFSANNHPHYTILSLHHIAYNFLYTRYRLDYSSNN